jgi:hypothetical protein
VLKRRLDVCVGERLYAIIVGGPSTADIPATC